jgi:hypothetical protein
VPSRTPAIRPKRNPVTPKRRALTNEPGLFVPAGKRSRSPSGLVCGVDLGLGQVDEPVAQPRVVLLGGEFERILRKQCCRPSDGSGGDEGNLRLGGADYAVVGLGRVGVLALGSP